MKTHKKILVLALVLAIATSMAVPLVAQTNGGMVLVQGGTFTMGNTDSSKKESWNADQFPAHQVSTVINLKMAGTFHRTRS